MPCDQQFTQDPSSSTGTTITGVNRLANEQVTVIRVVETNNDPVVTVIGSYVVSNAQNESIFAPISCLCHAITSCPLSKVSPNKFPDSVNTQIILSGSC
jgi:hypothetical protein